MNVQSFYTAPAGLLRAPVSERLARAFEKEVSKHAETQLILKALREHFRDECVSRLGSQRLQRLLESADSGSLSGRDLANFLNRHSRAFCVAQLAAVEALMSFGFRLRLEDLNAHFVDLEQAKLADVLSDQLSKVSQRRIQKFLASVFEKKQRDLEKPRARNQVLHRLPERLTQQSLQRLVAEGLSQEFVRDNGPFQKVTSALKSTLLRVLVYAFKTLSRQGSLVDVCAALNSEPKLRFSCGFWSRRLMSKLLLHYAEFELKCHVTKLLNADSMLPVIGYEVSLPVVAWVNQFVRLVLREQVGVVSCALGLANRMRIGKTQLLNDVLETRFETEAGGPFNPFAVDVDMGEGFLSPRQVAVVDCNLPKLELFGDLLGLANVCVLSLLFADLALDFESIQAQVEEVAEHTRAKRAHLIVVVRDWEHLPSFLSRSGEGFRSGAFGKAMEEGQQEDQWAAQCMLKDLKEHKKYAKRDQAGENNEPENDFARRQKLIKSVKKKFKSMKKKLESEEVSFETLKNLQMLSPDERPKRLVGLRRAINLVKNGTSREQMKFTQKRFKRFAKSIKKRVSEAAQSATAPKGSSLVFAVGADDKKVLSLYKNLKKMIKMNHAHSQLEKAEVFPFNDLWQTRDKYYKELGKLGFTDRKRQLELDQLIDETNKRIRRTKLTDPLREFVSTLVESRHPVPLLSLFERHLYRKMIQVTRTNEDNPTGSDVETRALDISLYWRNLKPFLESERDEMNLQDKKRLTGLMETLFAKGYGFELVDGDHFIYWGGFLRHFHRRFGQSDRLLTVSVKGPQSSGKSTLVNLQFGTDFKSGAGKCTSGINGFIMRLEEKFDRFERTVEGRRHSPQSILSIESPRNAEGSPRDIGFDRSISVIKEQSGESAEAAEYMFFLDSQGMLSNEQREKDFDRKIGTFLLAVSQVVQVNFMGEPTSNFINLLEITNFSYQRLSLGRRALFAKSPARSEAVREVLESGSRL